MRQRFQNLAKRGELLIPLSFLIASIYFFYLAFEFRGAFVMIRQGVGPDFFPKVFTALMMFLSLWLIYNVVKRSGVSEFEKVANPRNLWVTLAFMIAYAFLLEIVGFVVLTPVWIAAYMASIGIRRWTWLLGATIVFSVFLILVFPTLMLIPLPRGVGIFREISLLVY
jgi:putative tricarboxylic transport membrane protein